MSIGRRQVAACVLVALSTVGVHLGGPAVFAAQPEMSAELIFPLDARHNHAPAIVELKDGQLLVSWYRGSGERTADDVAVYGARRLPAATEWSEPFLMADRPGFPDCNTSMFVDSQDRLWLFWPTILANTWESCLTNSAVSVDYLQEGSPKWQNQATILLKPADFGDQAERQLDKLLASLPRALTANERAEVESARKKLHDKLYQRLGWQPRCKPTVLPSGRWLLPLYSDTFSISIMALSDDAGQTWHASEPLLGFGNIQPTVLRRNDGTLVAYMRENGPLNHVRTCESRDDGRSWGEVGVCELLTPGSGLDGVRLNNGHWLLVYNDLKNGRNSLAVSISTDEGRTWPMKRHLEQQAGGSYHYPAVIQGRDGTIHFVYSYFVQGGKSMKHVSVNEEWITAGDAN